MNAKDISDSLSMIDRDLLEEAAPMPFTAKKKRFRKALTLGGAAAAVLAVALVLHLALGGALVHKAYALQEAVYPEIRKTTADGVGDEAYFRIRKANLGKGTSLGSFFAGLMQQSFAENQGRNMVFSPLNTYMSLAMLSGLCSGETQDQILQALGAKSPQALLDQAHSIWLANYENDGLLTNILASSIWLRDDAAYNKETLAALAEEFYTSSFSGTMGNAAYDRCLRNWIDEQTGGLLQESTKNVKMDPQTVMALVSTLSFRAKWYIPFEESANTERVFHTPEGDKNTVFMNREIEYGFYYYGEKFGAIALSLDNTRDQMWLILPDEGVSPEELLQDEQALYFMANAASYTWAGEEFDRKGVESAWIKVNLSLPKFDLMAESELNDLFENMGITACFDPEKADFSPLTEESEMFISRVSQASRLCIDEEGVTAVSYIIDYGAAEPIPPQEKIDFILDRPFFAVLTNTDSLPLMAALVNAP